MRSKTTVLALVATLAVVATASVCRAESAASKAFAKDCSNCHEVSDFEGQSAGKIADELTAIVQGKAKHRRKLKMTPDEIQLMSQYLAGQQAAIAFQCEAGTCAVAKDELVNATTVEAADLAVRKVGILCND